MGKIYLIKYKNNTEELVEFETDKEARKYSRSAPQNYGKCISIQCVDDKKKALDILYKIV